MPTYEYQCNACRHRFERFQSMTARPITVCPSCGKKKVSRLIGTGAALLFKGSGFYITDYRSDSYKKAKDADKPAESKPAETKSNEVKAPEPKAKPAAETPATRKRTKA
ncbi:MAG: FmdB family zinc ribbon protein [Phycisphaerales bacterium]